MQSATNRSVRNTRPGGPGGDGSKWTLFGVSVVLHALLLGLFWLVPDSARISNQEKKPIDITFYRPPKPEPKPLPPKPEPKPEPKIERKIEPKPKRLEPKPEPKPRPEVSPVAPPPRTPRPKPQPTPTPPEPKPQRVVKKTAFSKAPQAAPKKRVVKQATAGAFATSVERKQRAPKRELNPTAFAQQAAEPAPTPRQRVVANASFDENKRIQVERPDAQRTVNDAAFAQETPATKNSKPMQAVKRVSLGDTPTSTQRAKRDRAVTQVDLGDAPAAQPSAPSGGSVNAGAFGSEVQEAAPRRERRPAGPSKDSPVEVLDKPQPVYTAAARDKKIEGEVVLKVVFQANGELRVLEVIRPLGHGLDEAATAAAKKMRFKPARRDGTAVDYTATLRVLFQLA